MEYSDNPQQRRSIDLVLGREAGTLNESEAQLLLRLRDQQWQVRVAAVRRLGKLAERTSFEPLLEALTDEHQAVRAAAVQALGRAGASGGYMPIEPVLAALHDSSWHVRTEALLALGKQSVRVPLDPLLTALEDEDESVRAAAVWAIGKRGEHAPLDVLVAALNDASWQVREAAALALAEQGERAPLQALLAAQQDVDGSVRAAVEHALPLTHPIPPDSGTRRQETEALPPLQPLRQPRVGTPEKRTEKRIAREAEESLVTGEAISHVQNMGQTSSRGQKVVTVERKGLLSPMPGSPPSRKRRPLSLCFIEIGLAAAVVIGLGLSLLLLNSFPSTTASGEKTLYSHAGEQITNVAWSSSSTQANKSLLAFADTQGQVQVWDTATEKRVALYGFTGRVIGLAFSAHGLRIALSDTQGMLQVLQAGSSVPLLTLPISAQNPLLAWAPDGERITVVAPTADKMEIGVWDLNTHKQIAAHRVLFKSITSIAWSRDGSEIATASDDGKVRIIEVWQATTGNTVAHPVLLPYVPVPFRVAGMTWFPDGERLAYALDDGELRVWDRRTYNHALFNIATSDSAVAGDSASLPFTATLATSPDGSHLAATTSSGAVLVWDATTGKRLAEYHRRGQVVNDLAWSSDGKSIALVSADGNVVLWKVL